MTDTKSWEAWDRVRHFIAQGVINISEGITEVEDDSPVHRAMQDFCKMASEGNLVFVPGEKEKP